MIDPADPIFDNNQQEANTYLSKHFSPSNPIHNKHFSAQLNSLHSKLSPHISKLGKSNNFFRSTKPFV